MKFEFDPLVFGIQFLTFILLMWVLRALYFKPIIALLHKRDSLTVGREDEAGRLLVDTENFRATYSAAMTEFRTALETERVATLKTIREVADRSLAETKEKVGRQVSENEARLAKDVKESRLQLPSLAQEVSRDMISAVLGAK